MQTEQNVISAGETQSELAEMGQPLSEVERIKVLLIEDNPGDAGLIGLMLADAAGDLFQLEIVDHLSAGFDRLAADHVGIILVDLSLPDSHGLDTFVQLHARAPAIPIIVLSGLNDTTVAVQAVHEGAQDFLVKGQVDGELLVRSMRYAIERKRMTEQLGRYAEELRSKNAQLQADFNMAREIQEIFLPQQYPTFPHSVAPEDSSLRFSHRYLPAAAVGGDFFDVLPISDTLAGVFICDVMGHGMRAALVTAIMRGLVEELFPVAADAGKFLTDINRSLHAILRRTREPFLATAFYLVADIAACEVRFANAGHPSAYRLQRKLGTVELLSSWDSRHGPALGLFEKAVYPSGHCPLAQDDLVLMFTDGLFEAMNARQDEFGQDRLLANVRKHCRLPTERLLDALLEEVQGFAGSSEFEDDVCLLAMQAHRIGSVS